MPKYRLYYQQVAESFEDVEADSYDEAIDAAKGSYARPCGNYCSSVISLDGDWEQTDYYMVDGEMVYPSTDSA